MNVSVKERTLECLPSSKPCNLPVKQHRPRQWAVLAGQLPTFIIVEGNFTVNRERVIA